MLVRAAKLLEREHPSRAISLYEKAADTVATEDRQSEAAQHMEKAVLLTVRCGQLDRAAELLHTTLGLCSEAGGGTQYGRCCTTHMYGTALSKFWAGLCWPSYWCNFRGETVWLQAK